MNIKDLFISVAGEACNGEVILDGESWPFAFNTILNNEKYIKNEYFPTIIIDNEEEFFKLLENYVDKTIQSKRKITSFISKKDQIRFIISYLFVNATTEEFNNPIDLLKKQIAFLDDKTFNELDSSINIPLDGSLNNTNLNIKRNTQSIYMETPYNLKFKINDTNSEDFYDLGEISYGIYNNTCYIYSMMNKSKKKDTPFYKRINRKLFKLNNNILSTESNEFKEYINNNRESLYYPENITDVSMPMVYSLSIFINLIKKANIKEIKVVTYLPLRYISRTDEERSNNIQKNTTDKLIRTFRRVAHQIDGVDITSYPYELDEYLNLSVSKEKELSSDNELIENINRKI